MIYVQGGTGEGVLLPGCQVGRWEGEDARDDRVLMKGFKEKKQKKIPNGREVKEMVPPGR